MTEHEILKEIFPSLVGKHDLGCYEVVPIGPADDEEEKTGRSESANSHLV